MCYFDAISTAAIPAMADRQKLWMTKYGKAENDIRRLVQIETAVRKNPKQPDFEGLDVVMAQPVGDTGDVATRDFSRWVAERQKDEAQILKQNRQWREERANEKKRQKGGKSDPPPGAGS